jgi:hypothetical protein
MHVFANLILYNSLVLSSDYALYHVVGNFCLPLEYHIVAAADGADIV